MDVAASPQGANNDAKSGPEKSGPYEFVDVLKKEYGAIHLGASTVDGAEPVDPFPGLTLDRVREEMWKKETSALCFSGGGIRSASFCLGAVQALAREGYLRSFHYLSTVSGGGYVGSLLAAWGYRAGADYSEVESGLQGKSTKVDPVAHLRDYTSYLTPRYGAFSIDTWTLATTYVRNLLLNWLILLPLAIAVLLTPHFVVAFLDDLVRLPSARVAIQVADRALLFGIVLSGIVIVLWRSISSLLGRAAVPTPQIVAVASLVAMALLCASGFIIQARGFDRAWTVPLASIAQWFADSIASMISLPDLASIVREGAKLKPVWLLALTYTVVGAGAWLFFRVAHVEIRPLEKVRNWGSLLLSFVAAGAATGLGLHFWFEWFRGVAEPQSAARLYWTFGPPSVGAVFGLAEIMFIGLVSKQTDDFDREWWARMGAYLLVGACVWIVLFAAALLAPAVLRDFKVPQSPLLSSVFSALVAAAGAVIARIAFTRAAGTGRKQESADLPAEAQTARLGRKGSLLLNAAGLAFLVFVVCGLALVVDNVLGRVDAYLDPGADRPVLRFSYGHSLQAVFLVYAIVWAILLLASRFVHVNRFSLHAMYRERLIRAFLGGTRVKRDLPGTLDGKWREETQYRQREADAFTQFDRDDNPIFGWLDPRRRAQPDAESKPPPFLIVNCALNLTAGERLAWQERKAASFAITSLHAGSDATKYRASRAFAGEVGGITLGTAMTISGAAVSPNAGLHSSPILAAVLTLFNARLGSWLGNPKDDKASAKQGPTRAIAPLARELLGLTDAREWIYLSDGGHFENLGIYEAVKRGCRYIVAIDASADPDRHFVDLGNAIRKIRLDLNAQIELAEDWLVGGKQLGASGRYCALFSIQYLDMPARRRGSLLYIKPSIYDHPSSQVPADVLQYWRSSSVFPHEPTTDQFFTESQFESYRALGEHELTKILKYCRERGDIGELFEAAARYIEDPQGDARPAAGQQL